MKILYRRTHQERPEEDETHKMDRTRSPQMERKPVKALRQLQSFYVTDSG